MESKGKGGKTVKRAGSSKTHRNRPKNQALFKRKAYHNPSAHSDLYEYAPEKTRRSKVALKLDREETKGLILPEAGDDDFLDARSRIRLVGESGEKRDGKIEKIASDD